MCRDSIDKNRKNIQKKLADSLAGPFMTFLPHAWIDQTLTELGHRYRERIFTPFVVLWAFIGQVLDPDQSCNQALARIQAYRTQCGLPRLSTDTGGYCKARIRLPEGLFEKLFLRTGHALAQHVTDKHLWHGRRVKVVDGSTCSMPDTAANQKAYPQPSEQKPGCGFPVMAFVGVFCLATGAAIALARGQWFDHDMALLCLVRSAFQAGDLMLADRGFCSYVDMALMRQQGVDVLVRLNTRRKTDFRRGRILGLQDHLVVWIKTPIRPKRIGKREFKAIAPTQLVREIRYHVTVPGFRTRTIILATTLLDAKMFSAEELADLYFQRWDVELDFRRLKISMHMDVLRCKTPEMVHKELWCHFLTYNLIRHLMWEASQTHATPPRRLSFKGAIQYLLSFHALFRETTSRAKRDLLRHFLLLIASQEVPHRPDRVEPRVRKRRPKKYKLMNKPRSELKAVLMER